VNFGSRVGEANVITPALGVDDDRVRALVVAAIDEEPGRAGLPHFSYVIGSVSQGGKGPAIWR
jgi:hypothetical protein